MKLFISWSGLRSHYIAEVLREWLPSVIQAVEPFVSSQDIQKGTRGNVTISQNLEEANVGIICLTPENLSARWILFEAGALSKLLSAYVCTYLWELEPSDIEPPLGQFQHTKHSEREVRALLDSINGQLPKDRALTSARLDAAFKTWWPQLAERLKAIPAKPDSEPEPKKRSDESKLDEILDLLRMSNLPTSSIPAHFVATDRSKYSVKDRNALRVILGSLAVGKQRDDVPPHFLTRLIQDNLISFDGDGNYTLTENGRAALEQLRTN